MADRTKHRGVMSERANAAADRIAARMKGRDASRLAALLSSAHDQKRVDVDAMVESVLTTLREAIENAGISRYAIEKRTGVTQSYLSKLMKGERGNLTIETLAKLAVELGLTVRLELSGLGDFVGEVTAFTRARRGSGDEKGRRDVKAKPAKRSPSARDRKKREA